TPDDKDFVEHLWARRKVGYLLDQIRANGEKTELVQEVVSLSKKYGIVTPYTSHLIVPDGVVPVAAPGRAKNLPDVHFAPATKPQALGPAPGAGGNGTSLEDFARKANSKPEELGETRRGEVKKQLDDEAKGGGDGKGDKDRARLASEAQNKLDAYTQAKGALE